MDILLVEDDDYNGKFMKKKLLKWGHRVEWVEKGRQAVEQVTQKSFDLVLLDIRLPDVSGDELIPEFKRFRPDINIITMTGFNTLEMERKIRGLGITYYMAKPISSDELKSILNHLSLKNKLTQEITQ